MILRTREKISILESQVEVTDYIIIHELVLIYFAQAT